MKQSSFTLFSIVLFLTLILFPSLSYCLISGSLILFNVKLPFENIVFLVSNIWWINLVPKVLGTIGLCVLLIKNRHSVNLQVLKNRLFRLSVIGFTACLCVSVIVAEAPLANAMTVATTGYVLDTPLPIADWYIGKYSDGSYFAINGSNWDNLVAGVGSTAWSAYKNNATKLTELVLGEVTSGTVYLKEVQFNYDLIVPESVTVIESKNGLERKFINSADSQGSPYTVSVDNVQSGYYNVQDCNGRICFTSTNRTYVMQRCVDVLAVSGGLIITDDVQWDRTIILPNNVGVTQQYAGQIEQIGASQPTYPRISKMDFYPYATLPDGSFIAKAGYPYIRLVSDEKQTVNKTLAGANTYFEAGPRTALVTSAGTLLVDCLAHPNENKQGLIRCPNASFNSLASDFTWALNVRSYGIGSGPIWGLDQDKKGNIYAGWYFGGGVAGVGAVIFVSRDDGITWNIAYNSTNGAHIHNVRVDPYTDYVYAAIGGDAPGGTASIIRSKDCGVTWETILDGIVQCVGIGFSSNARYFGVDSFDSRRTIIYRTTDDATYETVLNGSSTQAVYCFDIIESKGYLFAAMVNAHDGGSEGGLYYSVDDGLSWEKLLNTIGTTGHAGVSQFTKGHDGTLYFIDGGYGVNNFYKISFEHQPTKIIVDGKDQIINGTWINHHFGMKLENIQLTLMNNTYVNSTCYYLHPTVINNLPDGFQVSLLMVKDGEVIPVTSTTDTVYVMWMARR